MLVELKVSNFAIIENLHIQFHGGLNVLSGETGAGKSVLLKSLGLLMGLKSSSDTIRKGSEFASVEGLFDLNQRPDLLRKLQEMGIETEEQQLVVRRTISADKSKVYLNGHLSPLQSLRDLVSPLLDLTAAAAPLIEMTGQFETRNLLTKAFHLDLLDQSAQIFGARNQFLKVFNQAQMIETELAEKRNQSGVVLQKLDYLKFQKDELEKFSPVLGEETELESTLKRLKGSSKLVQVYNDIEEALDGEPSILQTLRTLSHKCLENSGLDERLKETSQVFSDIENQLTDALFDLKRNAKNLEIDSDQLEQLEDRLSQFRKLQKKYGPTSQDLVEKLSTVRRELETLDSSDERLKQLEVELKKLHQELELQAQELHKKRTLAAKKLAKAVNEQLEDLNMKGVRFEIHCDLLPSLNSTGMTDCEFRVRIGEKGEEFALAKVASGGELSRILLALKSVVGVTQFPRTYLFDEVDTGVSGPTAVKVGRKLHDISKGQQVICVTHLPQVAAFSDVHFSISKVSDGKQQSMKIEELDRPAKIREIARLISGEKVTKTSIAHAEQLLNELRD